MLYSTGAAMARIIMAPTQDQATGREPSCLLRFPWAASVRKPVWETAATMTARKTKVLTPRPTTGQNRLPAPAAVFLCYNASTDALP